MRPICFPCRRQMVPHKNGQFVHLLSDGEPYQLWSGDLWRCEECDAQVVSGFGAAPISEHYEEHFAADLERFRPVEIEQS